MKPKLLFRGPVTTASGYGVHARQLLKALLDCGLYDISVAAINWGQTPFIYEPSRFMESVKMLMVKYEHEARSGTKYDVSVQVTIPNEFARLATVNVGVTAGIEVDRASPEWLKKINENVDLVVVPSRHSAATLNVGYRADDGSELRLGRPLAIVPEGVDTSVYNVRDEVEPFPIELPAQFNFLFVGLGLDKGMGEDRKNVSTLIKWFCERFRDDRDVGLVLKIGLVNNSHMDFEATRRKVAEIKAATGVGEFPRIHLVHGKLSDKEMASLYRHPSIKAFISLTHGEGYGLPMIEAAACGLPVVATNWSGHLDFLSVEGRRRFVALDHDMTEIPRAAVWNGVMEAGSRWASVQEEDTKLKMKKLVLSYDKPKEWAAELASHIGEKYTLEGTGRTFANVLADFLNGFADTHPRNAQEFAALARRKLGVQDGQKTLLFTMPMSAGDVFVSTATVSSLRKKFPEHRIFFATDQKYADILTGNPDVDSIVQFEPWMQDVPLCETVFTDVFTPNLAIQTLSSNWVHGGHGRLLAEEIAAQCHVELGEYRISTQEVAVPEKFVVVHPGAGRGPWEARNYHHWQEVVDNIANISGLPVVQVGAPDDPELRNCVDLRGRTTYRQLAYVVSKAECLVSIDSVAMHMAAAAGTPHVSLFGSSYPTSTGPARPAGLSVLLETEDRYGCEKACYKHRCVVDKDHPCINEITPYSVVQAAMAILWRHDGRIVERHLIEQYREHRPKISGYTHVLDADSQGFPFVESITSMLGFCDEVVVVDGGSTDRTAERLRELQSSDPRLQVYERKWDWNEPGMDGMQKAFARAMCTGDFLWQQDADEVVHEEDWDKIRRIVRRFPKDFDLLHLPVIELWNGGELFRTDRHSWKWRLSRNDFRITHGINKAARVQDPSTGKTYAKKGMSDGCEYIDIMTGDFIPHGGFYSSQLEQLRQTDPLAYGERMNAIFAEIPSVFHYSWANIPRKIRNFRDFWDRCWSNLYNDRERERRFFAGRDPSSVTDEEVVLEAIGVALRGGEHGPGTPVKLDRSNPSCMAGWLSRIITEYRSAFDADGGHLRHDEGQAGPPQPVPGVAPPEHPEGPVPPDARP